MSYEPPDEDEPPVQGTHRFMEVVRPGRMAVPFEITGRSGHVRRSHDGWTVVVHTHRRYNDVHTATLIELARIGLDRSEAERITSAYTDGTLRWATAGTSEDERS